MKRIIFSLLSIIVLVMMVLPVASPLHAADPPDCTITLDADAADGSVVEFTTGHTASVPDAGGGATYTWTLTGDYTNLADETTNSITWDADEYSTGNVNIQVDIDVNGGNVCSLDVNVSNVGWPDCGWGCTAGDYEVLRVWLGDISGADLGTCTPGADVTAYVWIEINNKAATRYANYLIFHLYEDDVWQEKVVFCIDTVPGHSSPAYSGYVDTITWECGSKIELRSLVITWGQNSGVTCANSDCKNHNSAQCVKLANIVVEAPLVADFDSTTACYGTNTEFTDTTTGGITPYTYSWNFGDSVGTSTVQNPSYTYTAASTYTVTLTVTDSDDPANVDSVSYPVTVYALPTVDAGPPDDFCVDDASISLTGTGESPSGGSWSGTGVTDSTFDPSSADVGANTITYTYTNGTTTCTNSDTKTYTVYALPTADFYADSTTVCVGTPVQFTDNSSVDATSWSWTFTGGDPASDTGEGPHSVTYSSPGNYNVSLTVTNDDTCSDTETKTEYITVDVCEEECIADAGPDKSICFACGGGSSSVVIGGSPTASGGTEPYTYSWTPTTGLDDPTIANPTATLSGGRTYTVTVTDDANGTCSDSMTVTEIGGRVSGGGGVHRGTCSETLTVDFLGEISEESMTESGWLCADLDAPCPDDIHLLEIERGTVTLDDEGEVVTLIEITEAGTPLPPENTVFVGQVYDFQPSGITFSESIALTLGYDVNDLPENVASVALAYHTTETGWVELEAESDVVAEVGKLTAPVDHFSIFAVLAEVAPPPPPPTPATFELSNLHIEPSQAVTFIVRRMGEEVTITADVTNSGELEGNYTVVLTLNGETQATQEIALGAGESEQVVFTVSGNQSGHYLVVLGSLSGEFVSSLWINWWVIVGIVAALILLGWLIWHYTRRPKGEPSP